MEEKEENISSFALLKNLLMDKKSQVNINCFQ